MVFVIAGFRFDGISFLPEAETNIRRLSPSIFCNAKGVGTALLGDGRVKIPLGVGVTQEAGPLRVDVWKVGKLVS